MSAPTRKLAAILAADVASYRVPVMPASGQVATKSFAYLMLEAGTFGGL